MARVVDYIPQAEGNERSYLELVAKHTTDEQFVRFIQAYAPERKEANTTLILCILGFCGVSGIHRFYLRKIGTGIIYFLTGGLFYIGTILDILNYRDMNSSENVIIASHIVDVLGLHWKILDDNSSSNWGD